MPNYCNNYLKVSGSNEDIQKFLSLYFSTRTESDPEWDGEFDFELVVPHPSTIEECPKEFIYDEYKTSGVRLVPVEGKPWFDWYHWNTRYWGTKWNACEPQHTLVVLETSSELDISFDTAWSPCLPIIAKLVDTHPELIFDYIYYEPGMGFAGHVYHLNDDEYEHDCYNYGDVGYREFLIENCLESEEYFEMLDEEISEDNSEMECVWEDE